MKGQPQCIEGKAPYTIGLLPGGFTPGFMSLCGLSEECMGCMCSGEVIREETRVRVRCFGGLVPYPSIKRLVPRISSSL